MSEIFIEQKKDVEFLEKERDYLLSQEVITDEDIAYLFGSKNNYLKALIQYSHPRHNEATTIRNKRVNPKYVDPDTEKVVDQLQTVRLSRASE